MFLRPNLPIDVSVLNGTDMQLLEPLAFRLRSGRLLRCAVGSTTDGLSSPKFVKLNLQDTNSFFPAVAHDSGYRDTLEESHDNGATWQHITLTKQECDSMIYELCQDNGVPEDESKLIFIAVSEFGQESFDKDRF